MIVLGRREGSWEASGFHRTTWDRAATKSAWDGCEGHATGERLMLRGRVDEVLHARALGSAQLLFDHVILVKVSWVMVLHDGLRNVLSKDL